jgi:anti-anti-sigma factor
MELDYDLPSFETYRENGVRVFVLKRPNLLDDAAQEVKRDLKEVLQTPEPKQRVILSLERVETISSAGISVMFTLLQKVRQVNGQLVICGVRAHVANVLELCRVVEFGDESNGLLPIAEHREAALKKLARVA